MFTSISCVARVVPDEVFDDEFPDFTMADGVACAVFDGATDAYGGSSASASLGGMAVITAVCLLSYFM